MKQRHYQLRLLGSPPLQAIADLGAGATVSRESETVLITDRIGQGDLGELLVRISDLGLDIRELRRLPDAGSTPGASAFGR